MRVQIEQQRFLKSSLEAGILYADGVICGTLQINRHLLIVIFAEIKVLLKNYAETTGKYEKFIAPADIDQDDYKEPGTDLMGLQFLPPDDKNTKGREHSTSKKVESLKACSQIRQCYCSNGQEICELLQ